ncbi:MAG TPA: helix-turn-helix domain-containing protein [Polyangiaceae bacterium]|nr:helix-turn-helix domain-containing protein [Polyangiaceae bacterium]
MNPARRTYAQHCGLARALDVVGERWTLLVVRDLLLGPRRYGDLLASLEGITTNLLAKRLKELVVEGLVERRKLPPPASSDVYALTDAGRALEPVVMELARWGGRYLAHPRKGDRMDIGWALLSMKRRYRGGERFVAELAVGPLPRSFTLTLEPGKLGVEERAEPRADLAVRARDQEALFDVLFRDVPAEKLERGGVLEFSRGKELWGAFLLAFFAPRPA